MAESVDPDTEWRVPAFEKSVGLPDVPAVIVIGVLFVAVELSMVVPESTLRRVR